MRLCCLKFLSQLSNLFTEMDRHTVNECNIVLFETLCLTVLKEVFINKFLSFLLLTWLWKGYVIVNYIILVLSAIWKVVLLLFSFLDHKIMFTLAVRNFIYYSSFIDNLAYLIGLLMHQSDQTASVYVPSLSSGVTSNF